MLSIDYGERRVLVTGGTRGIGLDLVRCVLECGGEVVLTGTSDLSCARALNHLEKMGYSHKVTAAPVNFIDKSSLREFMKTDSFRRGFDVVINNAGSNIIKPFETYTESDYNELMDLNVRAPWEIMKEAIPIMKRNGGGRIVNIASIWATITKPERALYTTSKHAVIGMTKTLAAEYGRDGILVNAVSPGFTLTDLTRESLSETQIHELSATIPVRRMAEPSEIARVVLFLGSKLNSYINGQNVTVDGGFCII